MESVNSNPPILLLDIGSTYTKARAVEKNTGQLLGSSQALTTVDLGIDTGIKQAVEKLPFKLTDYQSKLACSSAAGGLKVVAVGLVPKLTAQAAKQACLGAGAKIEKVYSYELSQAEIEEIETKNPDIILLAGGTEGGNKEVIIANAKRLATSQIQAPIIVAGNKAAVDQVKRELDRGDKEFRVVANVMPEINKLQIEPARQAIREVFLDSIVAAKGLKQAEKIINEVIMPTPAAVLAGVKLLAKNKAAGLMAVDLGGATTDVYSAAKGEPTASQVTWKGIEEPYLKRTVEGDIGLRYSLKQFSEQVDWQTAAERLTAVDCEQINNYIQLVENQIDYLPQNKAEEKIEQLFGQLAIKEALKRHSGRLEERFSPRGKDFVQYGKDLTEVEYLIGTGGLLSSHQFSRNILEASLKLQSEPQVLTPEQPEIIIDQQYLLAEIGLMAKLDRKTASKLAKNYIWEGSK